MVSPPASQLRVQFGSHFRPLGRRGPWKSVNSWAALGAGKAEVTRPFRSGDHKAAIEEGPLVSTFGQGWLLSGPIIKGFCVAFFLPFSEAGSDQTIGKAIHRYSLNKDKRKSMIQRSRIGKEELGCD
ncbi:hypothetical protein HJG60_011304 [Phyllostomus discolor]|uniref:Uncharacterized protein n=1 Tax=Phyllostomus discolor TaxID=89673 RepID=A0A834A3Y1_9CHIR|nr:hypothetical protein HJG60_011304 [Phyllostomus discolor]